MTSPSLSIRLPPELRDRLEQAAARMKQSRSVLIQAALTKHLDEVEAIAAPGVQSRQMRALLVLKGAGARLYGPRSEEDIQAQIREFRGDE